MIILGLGSNQADRLSLLRQAIWALSHGGNPVIRALKTSSIYESRAWLPEGAPKAWDQPYLNLAALCATELSPQALLSKIKKIEAGLGRASAERWAPRPIDIDILAWDGQVLDTAELTIPHRELARRPFALLPLAELAPSWMHPTLGQSAQALCEKWWDPERAPCGTKRAGLSLLECVGIVNVTPDSFSDGGRWLDPALALEHAGKLVAEGATVLDFGAESTRPGATPVSADEEWRRLRPVLAQAMRLPARISVDTRHPETARQALKLGVHWLNDVSGFENPEMLELAAQSADAQLVCMHSLGVPADCNRVLDPSRNPMDQVVDWAKAKIQQLEERNIDRKRVILDPGIGFGKTAAQSMELLRNLERLRALGTRVLVGHSRKSFFNALVKKAAAERDPETLAVSLAIAPHVDYVRVHDVSGHARALAARNGIGR